jgi:hypothetical protein
VKACDIALIGHNVMMVLNGTALMENRVISEITG